MLLTDVLAAPSFYSSLFIELFYALIYRFIPITLPYPALSCVQVAPCEFKNTPSELLFHIISLKAQLLVARC